MGGHWTHQTHWCGPGFEPSLLQFCTKSFAQDQSANGFGSKIGGSAHFKRVAVGIAWPDWYARRRKYWVAQTTLYFDVCYKTRIPGFDGELVERKCGIANAWELHSRDVVGFDEGFCQWILGGQRERCNPGCQQNQVLQTTRTYSNLYQRMFWH